MKFPVVDPGGSRDALLHEIVAAYLEALDHGEAPPRQEILSRYPELAPELEELLDGHEAMRVLAGAARQEIEPPSPVEGRRTLGEHELHEELGRGGMGIVYRARERRLGRDVALKVISSGALASREERQRFLREARAAAQLDHPGVVPIYEVGEEDGLLYFTMKLVEGGSLASARDGNHDPTRAAVILERVALAVHEAHERGILHRDLKPANILLDAAGLPHVSDFGLARPLERDSSLTASGAVIGTASYMAPEQASAANRTHGRTADIYSLGAILYELLTGSPPFRGATVIETLRQAQSDEPRRPSSLSLAVPGDLETICLKCLEKRPERRYSTALELAQDLRRFALGQPVAARPISRLERSWRWTRRHPAPALAGLFLVLATLGAGASAILLLRERAQTRLNLAEARLSQAQAGALSRRSGQRVVGLRAVAEAAAIEPSLALRNAAVSCLSLLDIELKSRFATGGPDVAAVALSSTLELAASASPNGDTWIRELATGLELARFKESPSGTLFLRFSPDDRLVLRCTSSGLQEGGLAVWRTTESAAPVWRSPGGVCCREPSFGDAGDTLAYVDAGGVLHVVDLATGSAQRSHRLGKKAAGVVLDRSGKRASITTTDDRVLVIDLETSKQFLETSGRWISACHPRLDLVAVSGLAEIELWHVRDARKVRSLRGHTNQVPRITFSPGGEFLASTSWDGTTRLWSLAGSELLRHDAEGVPHFGRDGRGLGLVCSDRSTVVSELTLAPVARALATYSSWPRSMVFAGDETWIAFGLHDGTRIIEIPGGRELFSHAVGVNSILAAPARGGLVTSGTMGVLRWPLEERLSPTERRLRIGPPVLLYRPPGGATGVSALSSDGSLVLVGHGFHRLQIIDIAGEPRVIRELALTNVNSVALSPNGLLAAAGPLHGVEACVWNVSSGEVLLRVSQASSVMSAGVGFSPDGRHVFISSGLECALFRVGDWARPAWKVLRVQPLAHSTPFSFSTDGAFLAMTVSSRAIRIVRTPTGDEVVALEEPEAIPIKEMLWSPSGRWIAAGLENGELKLWDLAALRRELGRLKLDWEGPPWIAAASQADGRVLHLEVDLGSRGAVNR